MNPHDDAQRPEQNRAGSTSSDRPEADAEGDRLIRARDLLRRLSRTAAANAASSDRAGLASDSRHWWHTHAQALEVLTELPPPPGQQIEQVVAYEEVAGLLAARGVPLDRIDHVGRHRPIEAFGGRSLAEVVRDEGVDTARGAIDELDLDNP